MLFLFAGSFVYWQAWLYLVLMTALMIGVVRSLYIHDPKLLVRRKRFSLGPGARWLPSALIIAAVILVYVVSALDRRFGWSDVPILLVLIGDVFVAAGYLLIMAVFKANTYAAAAIVVEEGQTVASSGPYSVIRHPMYMGAIINYGFTPLALGSYLGLLPVILLTLALVVRIVGEEKYLLENLIGYRQYTEKTRYRLLPGVW
jgi:protein-S-isoprenylcysteine O-methyltransferase Ste14